MASNDKWQKQLYIGTRGESKVKEYLEGRQHWSANKPAKSFINHENIVCQAQVWLGTQDEHISNKDYMVTVSKPCSKCGYLDCSYKNEEPYEIPISEKHEVKTNIATHTKKAKSPTIKKYRQLDPTGNLFIEYWQDIPEGDVDAVIGGRLNPEDKKGWFQQPPPAWYHFYQPIRYIEKDGTNRDYTEKDCIDENHDDAKRFQHSMGINDRLILKYPWGYIVSIRGGILKEIEETICEKLKDGEPRLVPADNEDGTISIGTMVPVRKLLNNPHYYHRDGKGQVAFTPVLDTVSGTKEEGKGEIKYFLRKEDFDKLRPEVPGNKGKIVKAGEYIKGLPKTVKDTPGQKSPDLAPRNLIEIIRDALIWAPKFEFELLIETGNHDGNPVFQVCFIKNGWAVEHPGGAVHVFWPIEGSSEMNHVIIEKDRTMITESSGKGARSLGGAYLKMYVSKSGMVVERLDFVPNIMLLDKIEKWPISLDT